MSGERQPVDEQGEIATPSTPRVYVASLSDYNAGRLHGSWVDAAQEPEMLYEAVAAMLDASRAPHAEEWGIHDHEGFGLLELGEYESLETISRLALGIVEHGPAFAAWVSLQGITDVETTARFEHAYLGEWESTEAYAEHLLEDFDLERLLNLVVPEGLRPYVQVDAAGFGRDLELGGDIATIDSPEHSVYIFDMHE
jgi:antirestriction protein